MIHSAVDKKTQANLALEVTEEKIHDSNNVFNKFEIGIQSDQRSLNMLIKYIQHVYKLKYLIFGNYIEQL